MNVISKTSLAMASAACVALAGCGGGGGDASIAGTTAEGVYGGKLTGSSSGDFISLILENGDFWTLYGTQTGSVLAVVGFAHGAGSSNNGTYLSSNARDYTTPSVPGTVNATYDATAKTFAGTFKTAGGTVNMNGGPIQGSLYNYNTPAALSAVSGAWTLTSLTGEAITVAVAANGTFTASTNLSCNFTGTLTPRSSGKNVFNVTLSFGPSPCALPNETASGIAVSYPLSSGGAQLLLAGTNVSKTIGTAAVGTRGIPK